MSLLKTFEKYNVRKTEMLPATKKTVTKIKNELKLISNNLLITTIVPSFAFPKVFVSFDFFRNLYRDCRL